MSTAHKKTRYWYTIRSDRGVWLNGWTFGFGEADAANWAIEREKRFHPVALTQRPLHVHLQSDPDDGSACTYGTIVVE